MIDLIRTNSTIQLTTTSNSITEITIGQLLFSQYQISSIGESLFSIMNTIEFKSESEKEKKKNIFDFEQFVSLST